MVGLIFVVAVLNVAIGFGLAVVLGHGRAALLLSWPKFWLVRKGAKEPASH